MLKPVKIPPLAGLALAVFLLGGAAPAGAESPLSVPTPGPASAVLATPGPASAATAVPGASGSGAAPGPASGSGAAPGAAPGASPAAASSLGSDRAALHLAALASFGPRRENSEAERKAAAYLRAACAAAGARLRDYDLARPGAGHSYSSLFEVGFEGTRPDRLVFALPLGAFEDGEPGQGDAGLALALAEIERLAAPGRGELPIGVSFLFLGAERRGRASEPGSLGYGSESWIAGKEGDPPLAVVYLDFDAMPSAIGLLNSGGGLLSPYWHYERTRAAAAASGFPYRLFANRMQVSRLGLSDAPSHISPYLLAGIPAVELRGEEGPPASPGAARAAFSRLVDGLVAGNAEGFLETWDRHYLSFQLGRASFVLREKAYVSLLLAFCAGVAALLAAFTLARRDAAKALARRVPSMLGQFLVLFAATTAVYALCRLAAGLESLVLGSKEGWRLAPRAFAGARLLGSLLLCLAAISLLVDRRLLTSNPYFYEFASLVCLGLDVFAFSAMSPPLAFYFAWAFLVVGASLAARRPWTSLAAYALMYAPFLLLVADLAVAPEYGLYERLVSPSLPGALLLAAAALPFNAFTASPLLFFRPHTAKGKKAEALLFALLALAVEGSALGYAVLSPSRNLAALTLSESVDQDKGSFEARLEGRRRIGRVELDRGGEALELSSGGDSAAFVGAEGSAWVSIRSERRSFLGRSLFRTTLDFAKPPNSLRLRLEGGGDLRIYDCSLPYRVSIDGRRAEIFVGDNPPDPLVVELAAPRGFSAAFVAEASYLEPLVPYGEARGADVVPGRFGLRASAELGD